MEEKKKRVLVVGVFDSNGRSGGGISSLLASVMNQKALFDAEGYQLFTFNTCLVKRNSSSAGKMQLKNFINLAMAHKKLRKTCLDLHPDIVDIHSSVGNALIKDLLLAKTAKRYCSRVILHIHSSDSSAVFSPKPFLKKTAIQYLNEYCTSVVVLSESMKKDLISFGIGASKCYVVPNFVSFSVSDDLVRKKIRETDSKNEITLLFLGAICKAKGVFDLCESLNGVKSPYHLDIGGLPVTKNDEMALRAYCETNRNISYHGFVTGEKKMRLLTNADIMILPSYSEGLPVSLIEGISCGCCLISTTVGGIPEYFSQSGILLSPGDIQGISESISVFGNDRVRLSGIQLANYASASRFSPENFVNSMCRVYSY